MTREELNSQGDYTSQSNSVVFNNRFLKMHRKSSSKSPFQQEQQISCTNSVKIEQSVLSTAKNSKSRGPSLNVRSSGCQQSEVEIVVNRLRVPSR